MDNKDGFIDLGRYCGEVCKALSRGLGGRGSDDLSDSFREAIKNLTTIVADIQKRVDEKNGRNVVRRWFRSRSDKDAVAAWNKELTRILGIFDTEVNVGTHLTVENTQQEVLVIKQDVSVTKQDVSAIKQEVSVIKEGVLNQQLSSQMKISTGELPPPAPRDLFGRDKLIEEIVGRALNLESITLIGAGGIGKTSIALTVLHDHRIKDRFGDSRRFVRCDKFTASAANFLAQLSKAVGAGIDNPDDLSSLRPFLSSKEMILFLDNAESILDPQGTDAREIGIIVKELSNFDNICLGITSRISTVPPRCKRLEIPTLSMDAACDIFYSIYDNDGRSDIISDLIRQLDFHALSITLLATTASHNLWDYGESADEWASQRARMLETNYDQSLATTIELSLTSPTFRKLGPSAREVLGVIAFFPQGIDRKNLEWLFPTIPDIKSTFTKFCTLSLAHRTNDFVTMLAPMRDYLTPRDPKSSPLLCAIRDRYFTRLSVKVSPSRPGFEEARWIVSEDANVEHLLDFFTLIDPYADNIWDVCGHFITHLYWHKPRMTVLGPKIEGLPDAHHSKGICLSELSQLLGAVGNYADRKLLLTRALKLEREQGNGSRVAEMLERLADANRMLKLDDEGIGQAKEASKVYEQLGDRLGHATSLNTLAHLLCSDGQLDAAENAALRAIELLSENGQEVFTCQSHRFLGQIHQERGNKQKAIQHFETAISIASHFKFHAELFWDHSLLALLFVGEGDFEEGNSHLERAKSHVVNNACNLGCAMYIQAHIWDWQGRPEDAKFEVSRALEIFENLGVTEYTERCRDLLRGLNEQCP